MSNFTENEIKNSFIRLLEKKPLKSITIRDIVDDCGINRSSFYYHFQDIPALLEKIIQENSEAIIRKNANGTLPECMRGVIGFLLMHKKSVIHIYKAVDRETFEQWSLQSCSYFVSFYLDHLPDIESVSEKTRARIEQFYLYLIFGFLQKWINRGLPEKETAEFLLMLERSCDFEELKEKFKDE